MDKTTGNRSEWKTIEHAFAYLAKAGNLPHRVEAEQVLLDQIPQEVKYVLDLGTGDGRTLALIKMKHPAVEGVAIDFSEPMLQQAKKRFANDRKINIISHDLGLSLSTLNLGCFDAVISSLAIHHLAHERKKELYKEVFGLLFHGGVFCNLDHVSSPTDAVHLRFLKQIGQTLETEDPSNKLLDVETQLSWLREIGFADVDCYWKWLELALLVGFKP